MQKTRVHEDGGKISIWNQRILFRYNNEDKLLVQCMINTLILAMSIPLGNLRSIGTIDQWFQIFDKKRKSAGEIKMKIFFEGEKTKNHGAIGKQILHQNGQNNICKQVRTMLQ